MEVSVWKSSARCATSKDEEDSGDIQRTSWVVEERRCCMNQDGREKVV